MTRYLSEEESTGKITITHEEAMRELGKIEDDYSEIRKLKKQIAEMHQADLNRLATIEELVRCLENAIKFVYHYYGDDKEALADMETHTWRTIVKDIRRAEQSVHLTGGILRPPNHYPRPICFLLSSMSLHPPPAGKAYRWMLSYENGKCP